MPFVAAMHSKDSVSFPLNEQRVVVSSATLQSTFQPSTPLEVQLEGALKATGMDEKSLRKTEELEMNKLDEEEVKARRAELMRMKNVLFYQELKVPSVGSSREPPLRPGGRTRSRARATARSSRRPRRRASCRWTSCRTWTQVNPGE